MKNLKKLTRKGLDELANEMPQVNEIQQRECVGGSVYYDASNASYLYSDNNGNNNILFKYVFDGYSGTTMTFFENPNVHDDRTNTPMCEIQTWVINNYCSNYLIGASGVNIILNAGTSISVASDGVATIKVGASDGQLDHFGLIQMLQSGTAILNTL